MGTKKISQLETISDSNISGEAILPIVVSDPLIPNRKAKVNQLFRGLAQGSKDAPGLAFDLDRDSGLYQSCLLYTSPSPRDLSTSRMPSSA